MRLSHAQTLFPHTKTQGVKAQAKSTERCLFRCEYIAKRHLERRPFWQILDVVGEHLSPLLFLDHSFRESFGFVETLDLVVPWRGFLQVADITGQRWKIQESQHMKHRFIRIRQLGLYWKTFQSLNHLHPCLHLLLQLQLFFFLFLLLLLLFTPMSSNFENHAQNYFRMACYTHYSEYFFSSHSIFIQGKGKILFPRWTWKPIHCENKLPRIFSEVLYRFDFLVGSVSIKNHHWWLLSGFGRTQPHGFLAFPQSTGCKALPFGRQRTIHTVATGKQDFVLGPIARMAEQQRPSSKLGF